MTLRCVIFGHKWGARLGAGWHSPSFGSTIGAMRAVATCKRCGIRYADHEREVRQHPTSSDPPSEENR